MAFEESFKRIQQALKTAKATDIPGHLAVEIVINDEENAGIGYVEVANGTVHVEPYDYWNHDARLIGAAADLIDVFSGKGTLDAAVAEGKLFFQGERALELASIIPKPVKRKPRSTAKPAQETAPSDTVKTPAAKTTSRKRAKTAKQDTVATDKP